MERVYLLISGECAYDAHESFVAVCVSSDAAKHRAQRVLEEHWDAVDSLPGRTHLKMQRFALRWEEDEGVWYSTPSREHQGYRIEPWDVET